MTSRTHRANIYLFAKAPVLGQVKKRLATDTGERAALTTHLELVDLARQVLEKTAEAHPTLRLHLKLKGSVENTPPGFNEPWHIDLQRSEDFGRNLEAPFASPLEAPALVIGADHPAMLPVHIAEMLCLIDSVDVAVGPAEDGGFWALGSNVPLDGIFDSVPLGTDQACAALVKNLEKRGLSTGEGPRLWDVDTQDDLARWREMQKK